MHDEYVELDGLRFRYRDWGDPSAEPIVFLHGVLTYADPYDAIADRIRASGRRVIVLDQRGHGQSAHSDDYSWQSSAKDLDQFWDALGLETADVVAHSWGCEHACHLAAMRPDAVKRLALFDQGFGVALSADASSFWLAAAELAPAGGLDSRAEFVSRAQHHFPRARHDALVLHSRGLEARDGRFHWQWGPDPAVFAAPGRNQPIEEARELCARVGCPVLVVRAEHSELFPAAELDAVARLFPSATAAELPDSGHMIMWENPDGVADLVIDFLSSAG